MTGVPLYLTLDPPEQLTSRVSDTDISREVPPETRASQFLVSKSRCLLLLPPEAFSENFSTTPFNSDLDPPESSNSNVFKFIMPKIRLPPLRDASNSSPFHSLTNSALLPPDKDNSSKTGVVI